MTVGIIVGVPRRATDDLQVKATVRARLRDELQVGDRPRRDCRQGRPGVTEPEQRRERPDVQARPREQAVGIRHPAYPPDVLGPAPRMAAETGEGAVDGCEAVVGSQVGLDDEREHGDSRVDGGEPTPGRPAHHRQAEHRRIRSRRRPRAGHRGDVVAGDRREDRRLGDTVVPRERPERPVVVRAQRRRGQGVRPPGPRGRRCRGGPVARQHRGTHGELQVTPVFEVCLPRRGRRRLRRLPEALGVAEEPVGDTRRRGARDPRRVTLRDPADDHVDRETVRDDVVEPGEPGEPSVGEVEQVMAGEHVPGQGERCVDARRAVGVVPGGHRDARGTPVDEVDRPIRRQRPRDLVAVRVRNQPGPVVTRSRRDRGLEDLDLVEAVGDCGTEHRDVGTVVEHEQLSALEARRGRVRRLCQEHGHLPGGQGQAGLTVPGRRGRGHGRCGPCGGKVVLISHDAPLSRLSSPSMTPARHQASSCPPS